MFYPKLRHVSSNNSIIDISSIKNSKKYSSYNQNQASSSYFSHHHQLCHTYSTDSLDKEFLQNTKQTFNKLFHQINFNDILNQIQYTLQPIVNQLRQQIQYKKYLSKQDRFLCMKSCAKFIHETLSNDKWNVNEQFIELYQLQQILNHFLLKSQTDISTQTDEQLDIDLKRLQIVDTSQQKLKKISKDEHSRTSIDDLTRQKIYHRSVSRAFRKLNADLQKMNHETPFKAHLSKYHKHNH